MRDNMTLNSYSKIKGYKCNTVQKVKKKKKKKKKWLCMIITSKA